MALTLNAQNCLTIARAYYAAIDAEDADEVASLYIPTATLQFNADDPILSKDAIRGFSEQFFATVTAIEHTRGKYGPIRFWDLSSR
ncbi:MAG: nuclear transport factor 2 family protein [Pseudomonadota bacterium]